MTSMINRDIRQRELIPIEKLSKIKAIVVGKGAIGRQVSIQLATIGVPRILLVDFDEVNIENLGAQGFYENDIGRPKVDAVADICRLINSEIKVATAYEKFKSLQFIDGVFFCCVDKIDVRKHIFNTIGERADLFIDGRMSAEYLRVLTVHDDKSKEHYPTTLFPASEAYQGSCTAKTTIYCANIAAGIMVAQFAKWLRGCSIDKEVDLNLLTNEMGVK